MGWDRALLGATVLALLAACQQALEPAKPAPPSRGVLSYFDTPQAPPSPAPQPAGRPARAPYTNPPPLIAGAHWHHFHINSTDPAKSIAYFTSHYKGKAARFAGLQDAVWTQRSWLLFTKVSTPPSQAHDTAIWHIGWGAPDPKTEYKRQQALGSIFPTPLTDISTQNGGTPDRFWFFYTRSPDGTWIEQNTARNDNFGHMHLFAADAVAAGDWYIRFFGATGRALSTPATPPRALRYNTKALQTGPGSSIYFDNVNIIIYPIAYSQKAYASDWKPGQTELETTRGNVNDHFGVSVPNLDAALKVFRANDVKVTAEPKENAAGKFRYAFIEGPDHVAIELIEDHSDHPPYEE